MLWILVSSRTERERFVHRGGALEFGRGPTAQCSPASASRPDRIDQSALPRAATGSHGPLAQLERQGEHPARRWNRDRPRRELLAALPARLQIGDTLVEIESRDPDESSVDAATLKTIRAPLAAGAAEGTMTPQLGRAPASEEMARWFEALIGVQRAAASSPDFFAETARAVVELIGLDCGLVLLRREGQWVPVACHPAHDDAKSQFSRSIIETVVDQRRTFYQGGQFQPAVASLLGVTAVVASPVLDECQEVIGVVYGARRGAGSSPEIRPLERS